MVILVIYSHLYLIVIAKHSSKCFYTQYLRLYVSDADLIRITFMFDHKRIAKLATCYNMVSAYHLHAGKLSVTLIFSQQFWL